MSPVPQPSAIMVTMPVADFDAMRAELAELQAANRRLGQKINDLGYDFVAPLVTLVKTVRQGRLTEFGSIGTEMKVLVPSVEVAVDFVPLAIGGGRSQGEVIDDHARLTEAALQRAMRHAGETWVKHYVDIARRAAK